jgi:hypothetical protein
LLRFAIWCPFRARGIADEVAAAQLMIAFRGARSDRTIDHEQPLLDVLIVVRERFARVEVVEVHRGLRRSQSTGDVEATCEAVEEVHPRR